MSPSPTGMYLKGFLLALIIGLCVIEAAWGKDEFPSKKYRFEKNKKLSKEKDKLALWSETTEAKNKKKQKVNKATVTLKIKSGGIDDGQDSGERERLCSAQVSDELPDFFFKFGIMTGLISDVNAFKLKIKAASNPQWRKKRVWLKQSSGDGLGNGDKYLSKDKQVGLSPIKYSFKNNHHPNKKKSSRGRENVPGQVSACYGYGFLSGVDGLTLEENDDGSSVGTADVSTFTEAVMELEDITLAKDLSEALDSCGKKDQDTDFYKGCPAPRSLGAVSADCPENCLATRECSGSELCCPTDCGGHICYNPELQSKYRSADAVDGKKKRNKGKKNKQKNKCRRADQFVQCLYDTIGAKVCD